MAPDGRQRAARSSILAPTLSAGLFIASGAVIGLVVAERLPPIGSLATAAALAILGFLVRPRRRQLRGAPVAAPKADPAVRIAASLGRAIGNPDPEAAIVEMLRLVGSSIGADTVLFLRLIENGTAVTLEHPILVHGVSPADPRGLVLKVPDGGGLRMALAAGVPIAATRTPEGSSSWDRFAESYGFESAALVPVSSVGKPLGVLVVGVSGTEIPKPHLSRLHRISDNAGAALGAALRLRELTAATVQASRTSRFRADYVTVVGHELRTPLTTMLGVVKTLSRPELAPENPDSRDLLEMAAAQGDRLRRLVEDLLAIAKPGGTDVPVHPEMVSMESVVSMALDGVAGAEELTTVDIPDSLPEMILDPEHTRRVLTNLLANAVKYGEGAEISISVAVEQETLVITVADEGPGLPPAAAASAFEAFTQLKRTEVDAYGGIGLGLSVSQGLIAAMGGSIRHRPTNGGGATFEIRMPFRPFAGRSTEA